MKLAKKAQMQMTLADRNPQTLMRFAKTGLQIYKRPAMRTQTFKRFARKPQTLKKFSKRNFQTLKGMAKKSPILKKSAKKAADFKETRNEDPEAERACDEESRVKEVHEKSTDVQKTYKEKLPDPRSKATSQRQSINSSYRLLYREHRQFSIGCRGCSPCHYQFLNIFRKNYHIKPEEKLR